MTRPGITPRPGIRGSAHLVQNALYSGSPAILPGGHWAGHLEKLAGLQTLLLLRASRLRSRLTLGSPPAPAAPPQPPLVQLSLCAELTAEFKVHTVSSALVNTLEPGLPRSESQHCASPGDPMVITETVPVVADDMR